MKKFWAISVATMMAVSMAACGSVLEGAEGLENKLAQTATRVEKDQTKQKDSVTEREVVAADLDELEGLVLADVDKTVNALKKDYEELLSEVDTYEKYVKNVELVEGFYENVSTETNSLCIRLREYSIDFSNMILNSDKSSGEKYNDWNILYECVYENAGNKIFDEIYNGILTDAFEDLYGGILTDGYADAEYNEWFAVTSAEYKMWSDTGSEVYNEWSDCLSDIFAFWSSASAEILLDDIDGAWEDVNEFAEDIEKLKNGTSGETDKVEDVTSKEAESSKESVTESTTESTEQKSESAKEPDTALVDGMRPEFKEAMDSYEAFYKKYCEVLKKYNNNPTDLSVLKEYTELMGEADKMNKKFEAWDDSEMNDAETAYYVEVNGRVSKMLLELSGM